MNHWTSDQINKLGPGLTYQYYIPINLVSINKCGPNTDSSDCIVYFIIVLGVPLQKIVSLRFLVYTTQLHISALGTVSNFQHFYRVYKT